MQRAATMKREKTRDDENENVNENAGSLETAEDDPLN